MFLTRVKSAAPAARDEAPTSADTVATPSTASDVSANDATTEPAQSVAATQDQQADDTNAAKATDAPRQVPAEFSTPADDASSDRR